MADKAPSFQEWMVVELMGHRRLAGLVEERVLAGHGFLQVSVPADSGNAGEWKLSQLIAPSSVYALTAVSEAAARAVARRLDVTPLKSWEVPVRALPGPRTIGDGLDANGNPLHVEDVEDDDDDGGIPA